MLFMCKIATGLKPLPIGVNIVETLYKTLDHIATKKSLNILARLDYFFLQKVASRLLKVNECFLAHPVFMASKRNIISGGSSAKYCMS